MSLNIETSPPTQKAPLSSEELRKTRRIWRACTTSRRHALPHREPFAHAVPPAEHIKTACSAIGSQTPDRAWFGAPRIASSKKYDLNMMYVSGPATARPPRWPTAIWKDLLRSLSRQERDRGGASEILKQFSFPGGIGIIARPTLPVPSMRAGTRL